MPPILPSLTLYTTPESFTYTLDATGWQITWDVTKARLLIDGNTVTTVEVPREEMARILAQYDTDPARYDAVDPTIPGIGAPLKHDGAILYVLIDGAHRCGRCSRDGLPFRVRLLTDAASRACVIAGWDLRYIP